MTDNKMERYKVKKAIKDLVKNINETTHIPIVTEDDIFELFQLDSIADLRKVSRNFLKLSKILDYFSTITEIATSEKEGIVKFGIENGNAINAEAWKQAIGQTLGGYVSKVENKEAGKWYINDLTDGKIYKCIQSHRSTSFDITKFIDITNIGLSDKLENLFRITEYKNLVLTNTNNGTANGYTIGNIAFFHFHDVSPVSSNGRNIICKLPVSPLLAFEGTAVIIQNNLRAERFSVNKNGEVQIVGDGTIQANLKYSFSFSFPFSV